MLDFVHLHNHSDYSLLDGAASISRLVEKATSLGMKHLALTDHGNMFGALKFWEQAKKAGINPLVGCEFYVAPHSRHLKTGTETGNKYHHLVLLARDEVGYRNLMELTSIGYVEGFFYKPRVDDEAIQEHSRGLVGLSACVAGEIPSLILADRQEQAVQKAGFYREVFGPDGFFLELQDHGIPEQRKVNRALATMAKRLGLPLVATNDVHYVDYEDSNAQDILLCIGTGKKKNETGRLKFDADQFYLKTQDEMGRLFGELPQSLKNTLMVAEQCNLEISRPGPLLPDYEIPPGFANPEDYLRHLARAGLGRRYATLAPELQSRLEYELDTIISMRFAGYFLIVWDFIHFAKERGIPVGPGRGSGAGSLVAYSLQITDIDPIRYGLLFERFLNPERVSMPDFDVDFCFERRQEVIDYVTAKYGKDRVGQIITFGTLKAKAVIKDVSRVLDIPFAEAAEIAKLVPDDPKTKLQDALTKEPAIRELPSRGPLYEELVHTSQRLEGLSRHASTHAAGIVIGKTRLTDYVPLYRDPKTGAISTQYTMEQLEQCGLVKMDFLGLKTLTLLKNTEELVRRRLPTFDPATIPESDEATFKLLGDGRSACVFQFESQGMQNILKQARPTSIEDLIALNALYRPGPMDNIPQFVEAKNGKARVKYPLPELEPILKETYGVIVYQEQVMEIARVVGGYSLGQADILRRLMSKKKPEEMEKQKVAFVKGALGRGFPEHKAAEIFDLLVPFAGYGFNKSHAAAYSVLAYQTAYLKANFPAEFMAANLTNEIGSPDKLGEYIGEVRGMGIEILPPNINLSEGRFTVVDGRILYGLLGIKNLGQAAVDEILRARSQGGPYSSLIDFVDRVELKTVNRKTLETCIQAGLFDRLGTNRATLIRNLDLLVGHADAKKEARRYGQASLFDPTVHDEFRDPPLDLLPEFPQLELLRMEKELLGFYFSGHPLDKVRRLWERTNILDLSAPEGIKNDGPCELIGLLKSVRVISTKKNRRMAFAQLEDFRGAIELVFFSDVFEANADRIADEAVVAVRGRIDTKRGNPAVIVEELREPESLVAAQPTEVHVRVAESFESEDDFYRLRSFVIDNPGSCGLFLHLVDGGGRERVVRASSQISVSSKDAFVTALKTFPRVLEVWTQ